MINATTESTKVNSIFQREWWLETVSPGQWKMLEVIENGEVCARMPITMRRQYGRLVIDKPRLTQSLGPWLKPTDVKPHKRIAQEKEWMLALINQLPQFDYFCQNFHYSMQNWYPFYWRGFESSVSYTYLISDLTDIDRVFSNFEASTRYEVRKARGKVSVRTDLGIETLWELNQKSFGRWKRKPPYSFEYLARLDSACEAHQSRKLFFAEDASGKVHAAVFLVYDEHSAYYLVGGADPELRNSGAASLLIAEAIQFASTVSKEFNFEGSMVEPIEQFFRGFGGSPKPFLTIRGYSRSANLFRSLYQMTRKAAG